MSSIKTRVMPGGTKVIFLIMALAFLLRPPVSAAYEAVLKTQRVRVGEKAPLAEPLRTPLEEGRPIVLVLFPNTAGCEGCDGITAALDEAEKKHPDVAFVRLGGEDSTGAMDEEAAVVKRLYGFVTKAEAMAFYIDREGILRKITVGRFNGPAIEGIFEELKWAGR
ncbi:MAG: hypothetical protein HY098_02645 [Nitrospinae bacterium]|nr:hypothetical protein [Nitrospinota bacterium]